jgi:hypothetical protein
LCDSEISNLSEIKGSENQNLKSKSIQNKEIVKNHNNNLTEKNINKSLIMSLQPQVERENDNNRATKILK